MTHDNIGDLLKRHDPVGEIDPLRLAVLSGRIKEKVAQTPRRAPYDCPPFLFGALNGSPLRLATGALLLMTLGVFTAQSLPQSHYTTETSYSEAPFGLTASPWSHWPY